MFFIVEVWLFILIVLLLYSLVRGALWQNLILLVASYLVYAYFSREFALLLAFLTAISFGIAHLLKPTFRFRKALLILGVGVNLAVLIVFKYVLAAQLASAQTTAQPAVDAVVDAAVQTDPVVQNIILPIGISFYVFRILSYLFDVYARRIAASSLIHFAVYVAFFPQITSGPIERATNFFPRLKERRVLDQQKMVLGLTHIFVGFVYKAAIADPLSASTSATFANVSSLTPADALALFILFSVRLYADFAGYSAIAIGVSTWFGLPAMENFNQPYFSRSIVEFWTRWHISLSSWIRDYLFFPLSRALIRKFGSKHTFVIQNISMFVAMLCTGLWHGLTLPFLAWGALHGAYMVVGHLLKGGRAKVQPMGIALIASIVLTNLLVAVGWIFFGAGSLEDAGLILSKLLTFSYDISAVWWPRVLTPVVLLLIVDIVKSRDIRTYWAWPVTLRAGVLVILLIAVFIMSTTTYAPFIYQNF